MQENDEGQERTWLNEILEWTVIGITDCVREAEDSGEAKEDRQVIMFPNGRQLKATGVTIMTLCLRYFKLAPKMPPIIYYNYP